MTLKRAVLGVAGGTVVLVVWYGFAQLFPWGTSRVSNFSATSGEVYVASPPGLQAAPAGTWTTEAFEDQLGGRISTLATDRSFSWIVSAPREHYNLPRYFAFQAVTQAAVATLLVLVQFLLAPLSLMRRVATVGALGVAAATATYGGMLNWWGMPTAYGVGEGVNLAIAWLLAYGLIDRIASRARTDPAS